MDGGAAVFYAAVKRRAVDAQEYEKAEELFAEAHKREPGYPPITANWAVLKFYTGDYEASKKLISEAQKLGYTADPEFLKELDEKTK